MIGTRYFDELRMQAMLASRGQAVRSESFRVQTGKFREEDDYREIYKTFLAILDDPNTKRMLFDSRQAALFDELDDSPPIKKIHPPFDQFYMEFTEPIPIAEQEPGHVDYARAFLFQHNVMTAVVPTPPDQEDVGINLSQVTLFLKEGKDFIDRSWKINLDTGTAFCPAGTMRSSADPSVIPDWVPDSQYVVAGHGVPAKKAASDLDEFWLTPDQHAFKDRYIGWWERAILSYTSLLLWMFTYTMAKSVHIVAEPMSRPRRRWYERKGKLPRPWHTIEVEPKFYSSHRKPEEGMGTAHSYRYDVIGHLRFARHHILHRPGEECPGEHCLREQVEWVSAHQRGLEHTLYIPKTHAVKGGKRISPRFKAWAQSDVPVAEKEKQNG